MAEFSTHLSAGCGRTYTSNPHTGEGGSTSLLASSLAAGSVRDLVSGMKWRMESEDICAPVYRCELACARSHPTQK